MHRFIPDPNVAPLKTDPSHTEAIRRWTRQLLELTDDTLVTVSEVACVDAVCPLVETKVTVWKEGVAAQAFTFTRPKVAVTRLMLQQTLTAAGAIGASKRQSKTFR